MSEIYAWMIDCKLLSKEFVLVSEKELHKLKHSVLTMWIRSALSGADSRTQSTWGLQGRVVHGY